MSFEPQKFFVGLIDFFAVWLPGALLAYLATQAPEPCFLTEIPKVKFSEPESVIVFLFASYLLGHFVFLIGSWFLDNHVYDPIRRATPSRLTERLSKGEAGSWKLSRWLAVWLVTERADTAVDRAKKIKKHYLAPLEASSAINAFQWSKARLMLDQPQALETVQRFEADSKFFRSLLVVLGIFLVWACAWKQLLIAPLVLLIVLAFWRYIEQRLKATSQAYWYVITLESQRESSYRPSRPREVNGPSHAGGAVYRKRWGRVEYLLIEARKSKNHWVLPKGRIERGESSEEAAVREVHEEAAVWACVKKDIGITSFVRDEKVRGVHFYLMQATTRARRREGRHYVWLPLKEAVGKATHPETKEVLRSADTARALLEPEK